jgi:hypothetical protein
MKRLFVLVTVLSLVVAGCSGTGSDTESEATSTSAGIQSTSSTAGVGLPTPTEDACEVINAAEWERIATEAYAETEIPLPADLDFFVGEEPNGDCSWVVGNFAALTLAHFDENSPQSDEGDWCPTRIEEEFSPHEMMPEGVQVADIGVHRWFASDWRLHLDIQADNGGWWCFNYIQMHQSAEQKPEVEALGLGIASDIASLLPDTGTAAVDG